MTPEFLLAFLSEYGLFFGALAAGIVGFIVYRCYRVREVMFFTLLDVIRNNTDAMDAVSKRKKRDD